MQKFVSKYALAAHLALLSVAPLILFPFFGQDKIAVVLLWLSLSAALWFFLEPSRRTYEMLYDARIRVRRSVLLDPVFWLLLLNAAFAAVRMFNGGIKEFYDVELGKWIVTSPSIPNLPGNAGDTGFLEFALVVAMIPVLMGCRHALGKSARLSFLLSMSFFSGISLLVSLAAAHFHVGTAMDVLEAGIRPPSYAGCAFGFCFLGGIVALAGSFECKWNKLLLLFSLVIGLDATGLFYFAPIHVTLLFAVAAILVILFSIVYLWIATSPVNALKFVSGLVIAAIVPVVVALTLIDGETTKAHLAFFNGGSLFPDGFWELRMRLSELSRSVWRGSVWLGSGLGSFASEIRLLAAEEDWVAWSGVLPQAPFNGWWMILCERGIIGATAIALPLAFLLFTFFRRLVGAIGVKSFLPMSALGILAVVALASESFVDVSLLRPEVLLSAGAFLALSGSSFPQRDSQDNGANG